jgi:glycosyltransferase involved in cell wall biosynthesis
VRLCFLTSTPLNVLEGSGTYSGIVTLARALREMGVAIELAGPQTSVRPYVLRRYLFNREIARRDFSNFDATVGFDLDGFLLRNPKTPHIASIKGVIADESRFERGLSLLSLRLQAGWERRHVADASLVITTSKYSADRIRRHYGREDVRVVPELIDLGGWLRLFEQVSPRAPGASIRLLTVCRFYPRKNLPLLLRALAILRRRGRYELRIVGGGPEDGKWRALSSQLGLQGCVAFLGDVSQEQLTAEYAHADIFCFPSLQEGFGIVLLEAMAAGKPIVANDASAIPEVVPQASLIRGNEPDAWADAIESLASDPARREEMSRAGTARVANYDRSRVAQVFLEQIQPILTRASSRGAEVASAASQ